MPRAPMIKRLRCGHSISMRLATILILVLPAVGFLGGCGRDVPLGSGPADAAFAGDVGGVSEVAGDRGTPSNACAAAGGRCISRSVSCLAPEDPGLASACGDPNTMRCCMGLPDAGVQDGGPVDRLVGGAEVHGD